MSEPAATRTRAAIAVVVLIALALAATRLPFRWTQIALAYASYFREYAHAVSLGGAGAAVQTFVGIHPPLYSLLFLGFMALGAPPLVWFAVSGVFSAGAAGLVARAAAPRGAIAAAAAGLLLATSPHRLAYALEPNNYPLLLLWTAAGFVAFAQCARRGGRGDALVLATVTALGLWTHALAIAMPAAMVVTAVALGGRFPHPARFAAALLSAAALCLPLLPPVIAASTSTVNEGGSLGAALYALGIGWPTRYGPLVAGFAVGGLALLGGVGAVTAARRTEAEERDPAALLAVVHLLVAGALLLFAMARGTAATWQFPYALVLLPAGCLLAGRMTGSGPGPLPSPSVDRPARVVARPHVLLARGIVLAVVAANLHWAVKEGTRGRAAWADAGRTHGLMEQALRAWTPGSSLILFGFSPGSDDDKDVVDPVYRFLPLHVPLGFDEPLVPTLVGADPYWGQPVRFPGGRWLYTFTGVETERLSAITKATVGRSEGVIVYAYGVEGAEREGARLEEWAVGAAGTVSRGPGQLLYNFSPPGSPGRSPRRCRSRRPTGPRRSRALPSEPPGGSLTPCRRTKRRRARCRRAPRRSSSPPPSTPRSRTAPQTRACRHPSKD